MSTSAPRIGGSILPSNDARILQPLALPDGAPKGLDGERRTDRALVVVASVEMNTHFLVYTRPAPKDSRDGRTEWRSIIAEHANGYSCRALAERIDKAARTRDIADMDRVRDQVNYVENCGGLVRPLDTFLRVVGGEW